MIPSRRRRHMGVTRPERGPDLVLVDALARLQLAARRHGWTLRIPEPSADLVELLELLGLRVELLGEAEGGEEVGVEEAVIPDDPSV